MLDARRREILQTMGIDLWESKARVVQAAETERSATGKEAMPAAPAIVTAPLPDDAGSKPKEKRAPAESVPVDAASTAVLDSEPPSLDWDTLRRAVSTCTACALHQGRTQAVFGVGDTRARLMIIGEAPGADEDRQGEPFVGRAGQLLNAMLAAIGFAREQVYIANIVKCRPPGNRDPHADEAAACRGYLYRQIELIAPTLILSVGRVSAHNLLATEDAVGRLRGRTHRFQPGDIPLIVTYHPAYLLRRPEEKAKAWQDLQAAYRQLNDSAKSSKK
jgi:DNA polymerase